MWCPKDAGLLYSVVPFIRNATFLVVQNSTHKCVQECSVGNSAFFVLGVDPIIKNHDAAVYYFLGLGFKFYRLL